MLLEVVGLVRESPTRWRLLAHARRSVLQRFCGQEAHSDGVPDYLTARPKPKFVGDTRTICFRGLDSDENLLGDLPAAVALRHQDEPLPLAVAQDVDRPLGTTLRSPLM